MYRLCWISLMDTTYLSTTIITTHNSKGKRRSSQIYKLSTTRTKTKDREGLIQGCISRSRFQKGKRIFLFCYYFTKYQFSNHVPKVAKIILNRLMHLLQLSATLFSILSSSHPRKSLSMSFHRLRFGYHRSRLLQCFSKTRYRVQKRKFLVQFNIYVY